MIANLPKKITKFLLLITIAAAFLLTPVLVPFTETFATQTDDLNAMKAKSDALAKQIKDLQSQINNDQSTKSSIQAQIQAYDNLIQSTELQIQQKELTLQITQSSIDEMSKQKVQLDSTVNDLKDQIEELKSKADVQTLAIFQIDRQSTLGLVATKSLKDIFITKAVQNNAKIQTKEVFDELSQAKSDLDNKQSQLASTIQSTQDLLNQIDTERKELEDTQSGLAYQKQNKNQQISQIQANINQKASTKDALGQQAAQLQAQIAQLQFSILGTRPSGSPIKKGDILGLEGNSGFVCGYSSDKRGVRDICSSYFGSGWYLPATQNDPCTAAHVHFGLSLNGKTYVDPTPYINNGTIGKPLDSYIVTQGFGANPQGYGAGGHQAIDIHQYCGAPVKAAHSGIVSYGCDSFTYNRAKYAIVYNPSNGMRTIYWHLRKAPGECK